MTTEASPLSVRAERMRYYADQLAQARAALEAEILAAGWTELHRHTSTTGEATITYVHEQRDGGVDPFSGQPSSGAQIRTFDAFAAGEVT